MTRFARAKGSKSSNEKVPEKSTPWSEMKHQLLQKEREVEETSKREAANKRREENYKTFLEEVENDKSKNTEWAEFPETVKKVKEVNNNEKRVQKKDSEDEAPEECSSKTPPVEVRITKKKTKKQPLKIVVKAEISQGNKEESEIEVKRKKKNGDGNKKIVVKAEISQGNKEESEIEIKRTKKNGDGNKEDAKRVKNNETREKKSDSNESTPAKKPKKDQSELTERDLKKIEKRKQKRLKQLEKKKQKKAELKQQQNETVPESAEVKKNKFEKEQPKNQNKKTKKPEKPERRKQIQEKMTINGKEVEIAYVDGFPIKKDDASRIHQLRKQMISKGLPRSEINVALKLERRRAEKSFSREKKKVCFNCRKSGHNLSECPELGKQELAESSGTGICFKCGSTEHTHFECKVVRGQEFKFAKCFICQEQGHIARQCPDNALGLYPNGGACRVCGDVTHLKKDCPTYQGQQQRQENQVRAETLDDRNPEALDKTIDDRPKPVKRSNKIVKF